MRTQQQHKKAVSAIQLPNITNTVKHGHKPCHQSFPSLMGVGGWFVFLMFSTCKILSLSIFWWNGVSRSFCSCFRKWVNWNHQFPMTTGKKPHKECDFFCLFLNRNKQIEDFFFRETLSMFTLFGAGRKEPQSGGGWGAGLGSFLAGAGAVYIQVSLDQSFP